MLESDNEDRFSDSVTQCSRLPIDALLLTEDRRFMSITELILWVLCEQLTPILKPVKQFATWQYTSLSN